MVINIKRFLYTASVLVFGSVFLLNCEPDADKLGEQLLAGTGASGNEVSYSVNAWNISNNNAIQSDASKIGLIGSGTISQYAPLGAFTEPVFGMQRASYITQVRMAAYNPDFGANAEVDSVVLTLKPRYAVDSVTTTTDENYVFSEGNIAAKEEVKTYPVLKYGKAKLNGNPTLFTVNVHEVDEFLKASTDTVYSNQQFAYTQLLGTKTFDGNINSVKITKDSDNSELLNRAASLRINLDPGFFQTKIIAKKGSPELKDAAGFIRYFKGLRISVQETDGYIFTINPEDAEITMFYKYDKTENGTTTRPQTSFKFPLGVGNVHIGQYENAVGASSAVANIDNTKTNDDKLFLQGMGGPSFGFKVPDETVAALKKKVQDEKIGIISAKVRVYTDEVLWNNSYEKPGDFVFLQDVAGTISVLPDVAVLASAPNGLNFTQVKAYDLKSNPSYYDFTITKSLKDIVETEAANKDFIVHMGRFHYNSSNGAVLGKELNSRAYTPNRLVLVGADPANEKRIQLRIIYGSK